MKKGFLLILVCFLGVLLVSGCSVQKFNPFAKKSGPQQNEQKASQEPGQGQTQREPDKVDVDKVVVQMVNEIRGGFFKKAITAGEAVFEQGQKSEKFLDTLAVAYGYKNTLEGLNNEEIKNYLRVVKKLSSDDPANRYKKVVLAGALLETGNIAEGNRVALELYNSVGEAKPKDVLDIYGWGLYRAGRNAEAFAVFQLLDQMGTDTLSQSYHTAVAMESVDRAKALAIYKRMVEWANNALTWEENRDNLASTALINKLKKDAQDAVNRIQLKGRSAY